MGWEVDGGSDAHPGLRQTMLSLFMSIAGGVSWEEARRQESVFSWVRTRISNGRIS